MFLIIHSVQVAQAKNAGQKAPQDSDNRMFEQYNKITCCTISQMNVSLSEGYFTLEKVISLVLPLSIHTDASAHASTRRHSR